MIVLVPTVGDGPRSGVVEHIVAQGHGHPIVWKLGDPDFGYGRVLASFWREHGAAHILRDLVVVEHDVLIPDGCLDGFRGCGEPLCAHSYQVYAGGIAEAYGDAFALGCMRFSGGLMASQPDAVEEALTRHDHPGLPAGHWMQLDSALSGVLRSRGFTTHRHFPDAIHLHEYHRAEPPQPGELHIVPPPVAAWTDAHREVGAMWRWPDGDDDGRECWEVQLPGGGGLWWTTLRASSDGRTWRTWDVTGTPPKITVHPSINVPGRWHGFITEGRFA